MLKFSQKDLVALSLVDQLVGDQPDSIHIAYSWNLCFDSSSNSFEVSCENETFIGGEAESIVEAFVRMMIEYEIEFCEFYRHEVLEDEWYDQYLEEIRAWAKRWKIDIDAYQDIHWAEERRERWRKRHETFGPLLEEANQETPLSKVMNIIEQTYPHDEDGNREEGDSPISGADVVEQLISLEEEIKEALKH
jgi:hypothetical protein